MTITHKSLFKYNSIKPKSRLSSLKPKARLSLIKPKSRLSSLKSKSRLTSLKHKSKRLGIIDEKLIEIQRIEGEKRLKLEEEKRKKLEELRKKMEYRVIGQSRFDRLSLLKPKSRLTSLKPKSRLTSLKHKSMLRYKSSIRPKYRRLNTIDEKLIEIQRIEEEKRLKLEEEKRLKLEEENRLKLEEEEKRLKLEEEEKRLKLEEEKRLKLEEEERILKIKKDAEKIREFKDLTNPKLFSKPQQERSEKEIKDNKYKLPSFASIRPNVTRRPNLAPLRLRPREVKKNSLDREEFLTPDEEPFLTPDKEVERKVVEEERKRQEEIERLEEERKRLEEERKRLEEERKRLEEERKRLAKLPREERKRQEKIIEDAKRKENMEKEAAKDIDRKKELEYITKKIRTEEESKGTLEDNIQKIINAYIKDLKEKYSNEDSLEKAKKDSERQQECYSKYLEPLEWSSRKEYLLQSIDFHPDKNLGCEKEAEEKIKKLQTLQKKYSASE